MTDNSLLSSLAMGQLFSLTQPEKRIPLVVVKAADTKIKHNNFVQQVFQTNLLYLFAYEGKLLAIYFNQGHFSVCKKA